LVLIQSLYRGIVFKIQTQSRVCGTLALTLMLRYLAKFAFRNPIL
jgi:hypothetical protein